jgi:hypothetical protein
LCRERGAQRPRQWNRRIAESPCEVWDRFAVRSRHKAAPTGNVPSLKSGTKKPGQGRVFRAHRKKDYFLERPLKLLSRVSMSIHSSIWMKSATEISVPFFSLAGFMTLPEVSPRAAFSV